MFEKHEFVERIVPLHEEDTARKSATQVFVSIVGISPNTALGGTLGLRHLGGHAVLLGYKLLRYLGHCIHRDGEPVALFGVGMQTYEVMSEKTGGLARQCH